MPLGLSVCLTSYLNCNSARVGGGKECKFTCLHAMDVVVALHRPAYNKPVKLYNHRSQCGYIVSCNRWQSDSMNERNNVVQAMRRTKGNCKNL